ncbi:MAG: hypothetical protein JST55_08700 [Bacteroidetes bacterium]|nr:hypothetical protein [Bacteroidota bacterium]
MKTILTDYVNYNYWANKKICDLLLTLDDSVLEKDIDSSFRTIKETVYHIWGAEWIWFLRVSDSSKIEWPVKNFNGNFKEAVGLFHKASLDMINLVNEKNEKDFDADILYHNIAGQGFTNKLYEIIMHCMNHSTFHRGQIVTMLRTAGVTNLFSTDFITYYRER